MNKIGIIISNEEVARKVESMYYSVYHITNTDINAEIKKAIDEGCSAIVTFVENKKEEAAISMNDMIRFFVTSKKAQAFYVMQTEMLINASLTFEEICKSLAQSTKYNNVI